MKRIFLLLIILFLPATYAYGGGFLIYSHDASAAAQGLAVTARAENPSVIFYNPAAINQLGDISASIGLSTIFTYASYENTSGTKTDKEDQAFYVPNLFITHKMDDRISVGLGIFSPYGLSTDWPEGWEGRFVSKFAEITTVVVNPVVSWQITPKISVAAGFDYLKSDFCMEKSFDTSAYGDPEVKCKIDAPGKGKGYNLALFAHLTDNIDFGVSYRSAIKVKYAGDVYFTDVASFLTTFFPDGSTRCNIDLPATAAAGLSASMGKWTFEFDLLWTGWSNLDELRAIFEQGLPTPGYYLVERHWKDTYRYCFGVNYMIKKDINIRAGYIFDESPVPDNTLDPMVPDADSNSFSLGLGYTKGGLSCDMGYMAIFFEDRSTNSQVVGFNGRYESFMQMAAINLIYTF